MSRVCHVQSRGRLDSRRTGLTLLEVVLALSIFLASLAALGQLISTGSRAAIESRLLTQAVLHCETKLAEILAGVEPMQSVSDAPLGDETPGWYWSLQVADGPHYDILDLEVLVSHVGPQNAVDATFSIRRFIRDPQLYIDASAQAAPGEESTEGRE